MTDLYAANVSEKFWLSETVLNKQKWLDAVLMAQPLLGLGSGIKTEQEVLALTLGEARFGSDHWQLSLPKRIYYQLKPFIPRSLIRILRKNYSGPVDSKSMPNWPVDERYVNYQWEVLRQVLLSLPDQAVRYRRFWPEGFEYAFVLTHDIETAVGQAFVREVASLEESLGFRSAFNFVLGRYPLDLGLMAELRERGFEVGCHGLKHDGKLFSSQKEFLSRAAVINEKVKEYGMKGFRAPLTHRNPEWMQALEIEYDESFFDTDPFEPIAGGSMSIWPYFLGHFVELPYTLVQDFTLTSILGETSARIWLDKIEFLRKYNGMALLNSHPDYLKASNCWNVYSEFLHSMKKQNGYWHALPGDVANWWRYRSGAGQAQDHLKIAQGLAVLEEQKIVLK